MKLISSPIKISYYIATTMMSARRRRLKKVPKFLASYRQQFFDDPQHICFGCSHSNERGLQLNFFETDLGGLGCEWKPVKGLESFPNIIHGGISGTLLDEVGGVLIQSKLGAFALTVSSRISYLAPVYADRTVFVHARILKQIKRNVLVQGEVYSEKGRILSTMVGLYYIPSEKLFKHITKINDISPEVASYIDPIGR